MPFRPIPLLPVCLMVLVPAAALAQSHTCPSARPSIEIVLDDQGSATSGNKLGIYPCWMPVVTNAIDKNLCKQGHGASHAFKFTVTNECNLDVRVKLTIASPPNAADALDFTNCNDSDPVIDADVLASGGPKSRSATCTARSYSKGDGTKWATYTLVATHVRPIGSSDWVQLNNEVSFDPEIVIEDRGKSVGTIIAAVVAGLLALAAGWWFMQRRSTSR